MLEARVLRVFCVIYFHTNYTCYSLSTFIHHERYLLSYNKSVISFHADIHYIFIRTQYYVLLSPFMFLVACYPLKCLKARTGFHIVFHQECLDFALILLGNFLRIRVCLFPTPYHSSSQPTFYLLFLVVQQLV